MSSVLSLFTIYERPKDYPNNFVVRRWIIVGGQPTGQECQLADTLEESRILIPPGLFNLGRQPGDDPAIVETWV
jgi:hypothetical protein